jgi:integrase
VAQLLVEGAEDDDLVFPSGAGRWLDGSALRRRYRDAQTRAGLRPLRFHDLRHTFGTNGRASAESDREPQEWMGHAAARTTARYTHYRPRKDAANRLAQAFEPEPLDNRVVEETETTS